MPCGAGVELGTRTVGSACASLGMVLAHCEPVLIPGAESWCGQAQPLLKEKVQMETAIVTPTHCQTHLPYPKPDPEGAWLWLPGLLGWFQDKQGCCDCWMGSQGETHPLPGSVLALTHLCPPAHGSQWV